MDNMELIKEVILKSSSWSESVRNLGLSKTGQKVKRLQTYCLKHNIDTSHFRGTKGFQLKYNFDEVFKENSSFNYRGLKKKILEYKLKEYKCSICNLTEWQGKEISLQVDHVNGVNNDHRVENLRFLCPNCHSQTPTWGAKLRK